MDQIVVKTEVQANGEILLFYVDENEASNVNIENQLLQMHEGNGYDIQFDETDVDTTDWAQQAEQPTIEKWTDEETKRLLIFFVDNKDTFTSSVMTKNKKHVWSVACKTMLIGKTPTNCEAKIRNLRKKYLSLLDKQRTNGYDSTWPLFDLCHQAFNDNSYVQYVLQQEQNDQELREVKVPIVKPPDDNNGGLLVMKSDTAPKSLKDSKVEQLLNLVLRYRKNFQKNYWRKGLWETIALESGEEDAEYWHKRFQNFKSHYVRMIAKRDSEGPSSINWPYMALFDQIYEDDVEFQKKYNSKVTATEAVNTGSTDSKSSEWNDTEKMILVKYYFDCFDEFQDQTIPSNFLWTEVGRLLDYKPFFCKKKYEELRRAHLDKYVQGGYSLRSRIPLAILFDNIISKETELELNSNTIVREDWTMEEVDELVQFLYENIEMFKDPICHCVCFASIANKLNKTASSCKTQWEDSKKLYKSILDDKKENPDMQIDWRYIDLFDRIFDYGMDTNLLNDFQDYKKQKVKSPQKIGAKRVIIKNDKDIPDTISDDEEFDERGFTKRTKRGVGESKALKILEYYLKNKEKFSTTQRKKQVLWDVLAQQIGISGEQCAHRFRNLKQVYTKYIQREISKPEMPILWPYYNLCKKVFGYRAIKTKLKNTKADSEDSEEWTAREIKQIINYFSTHFDEITNSDAADTSKWRHLALEMYKTEASVNEKFLELQRSYKRLKTMRENNPQCNVTWKYYNMFDDVYAKGGNGVEYEEINMEELAYDEEMLTEKNESQDEDDYQCIIVLPEGQDLSDISNAQIIMRHENNGPDVSNNNDLEGAENNETEIADKTEIKTDAERKSGVTKWNKKSKKKLLSLYLNYVTSRKGKEISPKDMWTEISLQLTNKTPLSCKKMFAKLKSNHIKLASEDEDNMKKSLYYALMLKVMAAKPKYTKKHQRNSKEGKKYKDILLPAAKVELALQYYLQNIQEFTSPKFEKKYLWTELANFVGEPVNKLFNKINYLKQGYNPETDEVAGEKTLFSELLMEIHCKEQIIKLAADSEPKVTEENEDVEWSDEATEMLLVWYLANLEKFKNAKFVRKYLWIEASVILEKSPLACSKKMTEIRTQYKTMIKESPEALNSWKFYNLCQKIYGTGKKSDSLSSQGEATL